MATTLANTIATTTPTAGSNVGVTVQRGGQISDDSKIMLRFIEKQKEIHGIAKNNPTTPAVAAEDGAYRTLMDDDEEEPDDETLESEQSSSHDDQDEDTYNADLNRTFSEGDPTFDEADNATFDEEDDETYTDGESYRSDLGDEDWNHRGEKYDDDGSHSGSSSHSGSGSGSDDNFAEYVVQEAWTRSGFLREYQPDSDVSHTDEKDFLDHTGEAVDTLIRRVTSLSVNQHRQTRPRPRRAEPPAAAAEATDPEQPAKEPKKSKRKKRKHKRHKKKKSFLRIFSTNQNNNDASNDKNLERDDKLAREESTTTSQGSSDGNTVEIQNSFSSEEQDKHNDTKTSKQHNNGGSYDGSQEQAAADESPVGCGACLSPEELVTIFPLASAATSNGAAACDGICRSFSDTEDETLNDDKSTIVDGDDGEEPNAKTAATVVNVIHEKFIAPCAGPCGPVKKNGRLSRWLNRPKQQDAGEETQEVAREDPKEASDIHNNNPSEDGSDSLLDGIVDIENGSKTDAPTEVIYKGKKKESSDDLCNCAGVMNCMEDTTTQALPHSPRSPKRLLDPATLQAEAKNLAHAVLRIPEPLKRKMAVVASNSKTLTKVHNLLVSKKTESDAQESHEYTKAVFSRGYSDLTDEDALVVETPPAATAPQPAAAATTTAPVKDTTKVPFDESVHSGSLFDEDPFGNLDDGDLASFDEMLKKNEREALPLPLRQSLASAERLLRDSEYGPSPATGTEEAEAETEQAETETPTTVLHYEPNPSPEAAADTDEIALPQPLQESMAQAERLLSASDYGPCLFQNTHNDENENDDTGGNNDFVCEAFQEPANLCAITTTDSEDEKQQLELFSTEVELPMQRDDPSLQPQSPEANHQETTKSSSDDVKSVSSLSSAASGLNHRHKTTKPKRFAFKSHKARTTRGKRPSFWKSKRTQQPEESLATNSTAVPPNAVSSNIILVKNDCFEVTPGEPIRVADPAPALKPTTKPLRNRWKVKSRNSSRASTLHTAVHVELSSSGTVQAVLSTSASMDDDENEC